MNALADYHLKVPIKQHLQVVSLDYKNVQKAFSPSNSFTFVSELSKISFKTKVNKSSVKHCYNVCVSEPSFSTLFIFKDAFKYEQRHKCLKTYFNFKMLLSF